jgi:hypothetical protein
MFVGKVQKFLVEATFLNQDDDTDTLDVSKFVKRINIKKDYVGSSFPLFVIQMMCTDDLRNKIRDSDFLLGLRVSSYSAVDSESEGDNEGVVIDSVVFETTIKPFIKEFTSSAIIKEDDQETTNDNLNNTVKLVPYEITGIPLELIEKNNSIINEVYQDAKLEDIIVNIVSSVESNQIFVDKPDNLVKEESLIIPPMNVISSIRYLQQIYGVYNTNLGIFFDTGRTSVFKVRNIDRQHSNRLEILVRRPEEITDDSVFLAPQIDENNNIRLHIKINPPFYSTKEINMNYLGQTSVFSSYDYNMDIVKRIYNNSEANNSKVRYFWNDSQSKIFEESYINNIKNQEFSTIILQNINPNYFSIDTLYTIESADQYVRGTYMVAENSFLFDTIDYEHYTSMVSLKLIKIN